MEEGNERVCIFKVFTISDDITDVISKLRIPLTKWQKVYFYQMNLTGHNFVLQIHHHHDQKPSQGNSGKF